MAPLTKKTIQHSTHRHPLTEVRANTQFLCDGCQIPGSGTRFRCQPCDFDLHLHCANSPEPKKTIKHFLHYHPLTEYSGNIPAYCDGCRTPCSGTWYRCDACQFDLHQHCANSPVEVSYPLHSHPLKLTPYMPRRGCDLCHQRIQGLFYQCEPCSFDLHLHCYHGCGVSPGSRPSGGGRVQGNDREERDYFDRLGLNLLVTMLGGGPLFGS
ncbi:hypothetical protein V6N13_031833 [Hibiscus sabdariffa]|uniref:Phorbol-ester/DAG-type domain-containing protein n=1 Tax=Hibiscus sabdariffa TaxID=183260 RepID=A0ABR2NCU6_9ROSI